MRTNLFKTIIGVVVIFVLILLHTCKPETVIVIPQLSTVSVRDVTETGATLKGKLNFDGGGDILERGFYLNGDKVLADNDDQAEFELKLSHLRDDTKYTFQAFARNKAGTGYGDSLTFYTLKKHDPLPLPPLKIWEASNVSKTTATLNCLIERTYGLAGLSFVFEYSQSLDFSTFLSADAELLDHEPVGKIAYVNISDLNEGSTYYYRLRVSSAEQSAYSAVASLTTEIDGSSSLPGMEIWEATGISMYEATLNAFINRNTDLEGIIFSFEYSIWADFSSYQVKTATIELRVNGAKAWAIADNLEPQTVHFYRLKAVRDGEVAYSPVGEFTAEGGEPPVVEFPEVTILDATNITANEATINAIILSKELEGFEFIFQCDPDPSFPNPTEGDMVLSDHPNGTFVSADVEGLYPNRMHRYRLKMIYEDRVAYSQVGIFITQDGLPPPVELPEVELFDVTNITEYSAMVSAIIKTDDISGIIVAFRCGPDENPSGNTVYPTFESHPEGILATAVFGGLAEGTKYYYKLILQAGSSVYNSPVKSFTTLIYNIPFRVFQGELYIVATDEEGDVYVGGKKNETSYGGDPWYQYVVVTKFNSQGDLLWENITSTDANTFNKADKALIIKNGLVYAYNERSFNSKRYINVYDSETGELLREIDLGEDEFDKMTVDDEGYIFLTTDVKYLKKINPQGQVIKVVEGYRFNTVALFNDWVLVSSREKKDGLWYNKIVFFDKDLNFIWEDFGNIGSSSGVNLSSIISFSERNEIVVAEQIYSNGAWMAYINKYDISENSLNIKWTNLYHEDLGYFGLVKKNSYEFATFSFSFVGGPKIFNLDAYLLWEADPYESGYVATNQNKLFLTFYAPTVLDIVKVYDLP